MKKMKLSGAVVAAIALMALVAQADMSVTANEFNALDANGNLFTSVANGGGGHQGSYALVLDLNGNGWNGESYLTDALAGGTWHWDTNDWLLDSGSVNYDDYGSITAFAYIHTSGSTGLVKPAGYDANVGGQKEMYLLWFDTPYVAGGPAGGTHYGVEDMGLAPVEGDNLTPSGNGGVANMVLTGVEGQPPVPEPVTMLLVGSGAVLLGLRRKLSA